MNRHNYEYGTNPRKIEPNYKRGKKQNKNDVKTRIKRNEEVRKQAMKLEKKKHQKNVALVVAIFLILLAISYRNSLINEKFNEIQNKKTELSSIEKINGQLQVSIEESVNLSSIEQAAKDRLGMKKPDNDQKVYVELEKKDYVETATEEIKEDTKDSNKWYEKILDKIFKK